MTDRKAKHHIVIEMGFSSPITAKEAANYAYRCIAFGAKPERDTVPPMGQNGKRVAMEGMQIRSFHKMLQGFKAVYAQDPLFKKLYRLLGAATTDADALPPALAGLMERSQGLPEGALTEGSALPEFPDPEGTSPAYKRAVTRFEKACEERAFAGAQPPEDRPLIEAEYKEAKAALYRACLNESARRAVEHA